MAPSLIGRVRTGRESGPSARQGVGDRAEQHGGQISVAAPWRSAGAHADLFSLRHGLERDRQDAWLERPARGPARLCPGLPRRGGVRRTAGDAGGARGLVRGRFSGGRGGRARFRPRRDAAVASRSGRRWRVRRLCGRQEIGEWRGARGGDLHAGRAQRVRRGRRPARCRADVAARALSAARPLRSPAVREPDRPRRAARTLRHAGVARPGARSHAGLWSSVRRSEHAGGVFQGRQPARRGAATGAVGSRRDSVAAPCRRRG